MSLATSTQQTLDEPQECPHENRTLDQDILRCFPCYMAQFEGTSFTMEVDDE